MNTTIRIYHATNATDTFGTTNATDYREVFSYHTPHSNTDDRRIAEDALTMTSVGSEYGDPHATHYRSLATRRILKGDVISIDDRFYHLDGLGWAPVDPATLTFNH